ncbi:patched domain-containing protein 1-like [Centruroides vittatus]|uniref:patched domain-containing protein 1-like n=1 Tax=Centruroides vittatus TaxID=120091 RepID=UPI00350ED5D4
MLSVFQFGGVTVDGENMIRDSKAIRLGYMMDHTTEEKKQMALKWEQMCLETLENIHFKNIKISKFLSHGVDEEVNRIGESLFFLAIIIAPIMLLFSAISFLSTDAVSSKPWLGIAGGVSPFLATVAAFGLLCYCKVDYILLNITILFLMLDMSL